MADKRGAVPSAVDQRAVVEPRAGIDAPLGRLSTIHKVVSQVTDGRLAIIEHRLPAGRLATPRHRHAREDELSFVVAGHMGALLGDDVVHARAGAYVLKPRGQWHTLWNAGSSELRFIELIVPGGFESYLERLSPLLGAAPVSDVATIERAAAEYGVEYDFASVPEICARFAVTLEDWPSSDRDIG
jgi:mannose-6-phosphate isomerase-like protein (cupin superfamily)